jgi:hypothetical protein
MSKQRANHGSAYLEGYVYVFGAMFGSSCEKLVLTENAWLPTRSPGTPKAQPICLAAFSQIYIADFTCDFIETYNPITDQYTQIFTTSDLVQSEKILCIWEQKLYVICVLDEDESLVRYALPREMG